MKNLHFILCLVFIGQFSNTFSQGCKYHKNEIDPFSNKRLVVSLPFYITLNYGTLKGILGNFKLENDSASIILDFTDSKLLSDFDMNVSKDDYVMFKFEDKAEILKLYPKYSSNITVKNIGLLGAAISGISEIKELEIEYKISKEELLFFCMNKLEKTRISYNNVSKFSDYNTNDKSKKNSIIEISRCFYTALDKNEKTNSK